MADKEEAPEAKEAEGPAKKKGGGKMILIVLLILLPAGAAGGTYFAMAGKKPHAKEEPEKPTIGPVLPLESFVVNLSEQGAIRYLKLTVDMELGPKVVEDEAKKLMPRFRDPILVFLSGLREADVQKPDTKTVIKKKMVDVAATVFGKGQVKAFYYKEFVTQ